MAQSQDQDAEEWISPIGQSIDEFIAEQEEHNPEFKKERERNRPGENSQGC